MPQIFEEIIPSIASFLRLPGQLECRDLVLCSGKVEQSKDPIITYTTIVPGLTLLVFVGAVRSYRFFNHRTSVAVREYWWYCSCSYLNQQLKLSVIQQLNLAQPALGHLKGKQKRKFTACDTDFILTWFSDIREVEVRHKNLFKNESDSRKWTAYLLSDRKKRPLTLTINTLSKGFVTIATEESKAHETYYKLLPSLFSSQFDCLTQISWLLQIKLLQIKHFIHSLSLNIRSPLA